MYIESPARCCCSQPVYLPPGDVCQVNVTGLGTPVVKRTKPGTDVAPVIGRPVRLWMVPPVSPAKSPVSIAPVVETNDGLNLMLIALTETFPAMLAIPVTGVAFSELTRSNAGTANMFLKTVDFNFIFLPKFPIDKPSPKTQVYDA